MKAGDSEFRVHLTQLLIWAVRPVRYGVPGTTKVAVRFSEGDDTDDSVIR
jgi:hypothetical protein